MEYASCITDFAKQSFGEFHSKMWAFEKITE